MEHKELLKVQWDWQIGKLLLLCVCICVRKGSCACGKEVSGSG